MTRIWLGCAAAALVCGCTAYPDTDERFDDEIVVTGYDKDADFESYKTFSIEPEVHLIKGDDDGDVENETLDPEYGDELIAQVVKNLKDAGYEQVDKDANPDLGVSMTAINAVVSGTVSAWWGYGGYWGYPYYGYYYPYYYSYAYRTGSLITEMVDLKNAPDPEPTPNPGDTTRANALSVVWSSLGYRVLDSSNKVNLSWAKDCIDQAFEQSPYLGSE